MNRRVNFLDYKRKINDTDVIVVGRLFTSYGYYLVVPFLTVYLIKDLKMTLVQVGILLGILNFCRRGFGLVAGYLSDSYGAKKILLIGVLAEVVAYYFYSVSNSYHLLICVVSLSGIGGCLYNISSRSILANGKSESKIAESFSLFYITMHIGALLGPFTYNWLSENNNVRASFLLAASLYFILFIVAFATLKNFKEDANSRVCLKDISTIFFNKNFVIYCIIVSFSWFIATQLYCGLPMYIIFKKYSTSTIAYLNIVNAVIIIILLYPYGKYLDKIDSQKKMLMFTSGILIMSCGWFLCTILNGELIMIYAATIVFTLGEILFIGTVDVLASSFAPSGQAGMYIGISTVMWGIGGSLGSLFGGIGFNYFEKTNSIHLFWWSIALVGIFTTLMAIFFKTIIFQKKTIEIESINV